MALTWAIGAALTTRWRGGPAHHAQLARGPYLLAATSASGLLTAATAGLVGTADARWPPISAAALVVLAGAAACWVIPAPRTAATSVIARVPRLLITMLLVWAAGGWLVAVILPALPAASGHADAGILATVRTSVLASAALGLAWAGRSERFRESAWLLYPLLALGGLKLLVEDLPRSQPATLFIALAMYGGALIVAPRLGRGVGIAAPPTGA